jgi:hypothetical protein
MWPGSGSLHIPERAICEAVRLRLKISPKGGLRKLDMPVKPTEESCSLGAEPSPKREHVTCTQEGY